MNIDEYERNGWVPYTALAKAVSAILSTAISAENGYQLQQIKDRAKQPDSLRKKLENRNKLATTTLESEIKDLAGCRVIFYTNNDVTRFLNSGIVNQNFEVLETKIHHPARETEDATELYISNHFIVRLSPERVALPEYASLAGMRCEIQVQTILNHAWAEMAHDTIYKTPILGNFGGKAFDGIKQRMHKIARKYLLPAGYEFQKIATDFQRLLAGKDLFDGDALEAIVEAADNNARAETLEIFAENVLPLYDDLQALYSDILKQLLVAATRARIALPVAIETPYGALPAKTYSDINSIIANILTRYRYVDVTATFNAALKLYTLAQSDDEQKSIRALGKSLAKNQLHAWQHGGPFVQEILIERIQAIGNDDQKALRPLLTDMLGDMLGADISGTTYGSAAVTMHRGSVVASDALRSVRTNAIELLQHQFTRADDDKERGEILFALQAALRPPMSSGYSNTLARLIMDDTNAILEFQLQIARQLSHELLQITEERVHRCFWMYAELSETMRSDPELVVSQKKIQAAALKFRDAANENIEFTIYKSLVGFNSVFPPAWTDKSFHYEQQNTYRTVQTEILLASVNEASANIWFDRITRCSQTKSNDAATFPVFSDFLERLAKSQPGIVLSYFDRMDESLSHFLPSMLAGVMRSSKHDEALGRIYTWLHEGKHLGSVAWYLRFADPFDERLLRNVLDRAIQHADRHAARNVLIASTTQFVAHPGTLITEVFLPALAYLNEAMEFNWVRMPWFSWLENPMIRALEEHQANIVLEVLIAYPELESSAEYIVAAIAERWPESVIAFIGKRQEFARSDTAPSRYDAIPYEVHQLKKSLAVAPELMMSGARIWFESHPETFTYDGGRLLASVFPELSNDIEALLSELIDTRSEHDMTFVLAVLSAYEGTPCVFKLVRSIVPSLNPENSLWKKAESVLHQSGIVSGEFGSAELYASRKELLKPWLLDPNETVQKFAAKQISEFDRIVAAETRSAETSIALRKLNYGEELDSEPQK